MKDVSLSAYKGESILRENSLFRQDLKITGKMMKIINNKGKTPSEDCKNIWKVLRAI